MPLLRPQPLILLLGLLLLAGCDGNDRMRIRVGDAYAWVEVAASDEARRKGLMYRERLGEDEGMLFILPEARQMRMWMLNTSIPLDAGFFDADGVLRQVVSMEPDGGQRIYASDDRVLYALEMNRGWFEHNGVRPGARLLLR